MISKLRAEHVEHIPDELEEGVLYVSLAYNLAIHLCCCGCGEQSVTPICDGEWTYDEDTVTLHPSVGNRFACKSHYWVRNGLVLWA